MILFDDEESDLLAKAYGVSDVLPKRALPGLIGWDDFFMVNSGGTKYRIPTLPMDAQCLEKLDLSLDGLEPFVDQKYLGKIRWHINPVGFGGDPKMGENAI